MKDMVNDSRLDMHDPELLFIVSEAAAEFDFAANGHPPDDFQATHRLAEVLQQWVPNRVGDGTTVAHFDVSTVGIASQVFDAKKSTRVSEVVNQIWELAEKFRQIERCSDREQLENYRGVCVKLGRSLLDFRASVDQYCPANPYKR